MKQHALCKRVDVLVQQTDDLQSSLEECEDEKVELADKLTQIIQEKDTLQEQLTQQQVKHVHTLMCVISDPVFFHAQCQILAQILRHWLSHCYVIIFKISNFH